MPERVILTPVDASTSVMLASTSAILDAADGSSSVSLLSPDRMMPATPRGSGLAAGPALAAEWAAESAAG